MNSEIERIKFEKKLEKEESNKIISEFQTTLKEKDEIFEKELEKKKIEYQQYLNEQMEEKENIKSQSIEYKMERDKYKVDLDIASEENKNLSNIIEEQNMKFNEILKEKDEYYKNQIQWPSDRAKLIFDETKNFVSQNITLHPQQQNEIKIYKIIFKELRQYPPGNYFASASFEVNGKSYGDKINFVINIKAKNNNRDESLQKVDAFRDMFNLDKNDFSDELLLEKLKENNFNYEGAFGALFG